MQLAVIGTGYVDLVTGACFAEFGMDAMCVDIDADQIARLSAGHIPIYEPEAMRELSLRLRRRRQMNYMQNTPRY